MRRIGSTLGAALLATSLVGCGTSATTMMNGERGAFRGLGFGPTAGSQASWTILVHLAASNNLERFAYINMNEAEAGLTSDRINMIILFDGQRQGDSKIVKIVHDPAGMNSTLVSTVIDDQGAVIPANNEIDSGDPETLKRFVSWAAKAFPADRFMLDIWDHGSGLFTPQGQRLNMGPGVDRQQLAQALQGQIKPLGFAWDDETNNHMKTHDITGILAAGAKAAGKPFDILGFDACLMAHTEIAYQMKGYAENLVASEELEPGYGWDYNLWMKKLSANPAADGETMASYLVQAFGESYSPGGAHYGGRQQDITLSNISYGKLTGNLVPALNRLASDMMASLPGSQQAIKAARSRAQEFYNRDCADLGSFLGYLSAADVPASVKGSAQSALAAYKTSVTSEIHSNTLIRSVGGATGQVIFWPETKYAYKKDYSNPAKFAFATEQWDDFLQAFLQ